MSKREAMRLQIGARVRWKGDGGLGTVSDVDCASEQVEIKWDDGKEALFHFDECRGVVLARGEV